MGLYLFGALALLHLPVAWDWLYLFYPALFSLDVFAPVVYVAVGVDPLAAFVATWTALTGLYGLTYEAVGRWERFKRLVEKIAKLRGIRVRWAGYLAVVASAVMLGAMPTALVVRLLGLPQVKALLIYATTALAFSLPSAYLTDLVKEYFAYLIVDS